MIGGNEGVGVVQKVGEQVSSLKEKDTVMLIRPYKGLQWILAFIA